MSWQCFWRCKHRDKVGGGFVLACHLVLTLIRKYCHLVLGNKNYVCLTSAVERASTHVAAHFPAGPAFQGAFSEGAALHLQWFTLYIFNFESLHYSNKWEKSQKLHLHLQYTFLRQVNASCIGDCVGSRPPHRQPQPNPTLCHTGITHKPIWHARPRRVPVSWSCQTASLVNRPYLKASRYGGVMLWNATTRTELFICVRRQWADLRTCWLGVLRGMI